jgi:hypothetical protein
MFFTVGEGFILDNSRSMTIRFLSRASQITIPTSVEVISKSCFGMCEQISGVGFAEGSQLREIQIPAFQECSSLERYLGWCFFQCSSFRDITVPSSNFAGMVILRNGQRFRISLLNCAIIASRFSAGLRSSRSGHFLDRSLDRPPFIDADLQGFIIFSRSNIQTNLEVIVELSRSVFTKPPALIAQIHTHPGSLNPSKTVMSNNVISLMTCTMLYPRQTRLLCAALFALCSCESAGFRDLKGLIHLKI